MVRSHHNALQLVAIEPDHRTKLAVVDVDVSRTAVGMARHGLVALRTDEVAVGIRIVARLETRFRRTPQGAQKLDQRQKVSDGDQQAAALGAIQHGPVLDSPFREERLAGRADLGSLRTYLNFVFVGLYL